MDLTRAVMYRGYELNTLRYDGETHDHVGCEIISVQYGQVVGIGYDEKRALDEGRDASDVYLDQRLISLAGNVYGRSKAEAFDQWARFCEVLSPSAAYRADSSHRGYSPLTFWRQTADSNFPDGLIHQMLQARPLATPSARFDSDVHGGTDRDALAIPWTAQMTAKDPRITNVAGTSTPLTPLKNGSGSIRNRGTVPAVLEVYIVIPNGITTSGPGQLRLIIGTLELVFSLPRSSYTHVLRYSTDQKTVAYGRPGRAAAMRMDLLDISKGQPGRHIPVGQSTYEWHLTSAAGKPLNAGSYFLFRDSWV